MKGIRSLPIFTAAGPAILAFWCIVGLSYCDTAPLFAPQLPAEASTIPIKVTAALNSVAENHEVGDSKVPANTAESVALPNPNDPASRKQKVDISDLHADATQQLGTWIALAAAMSGNLGKVCQKRGTQELPMLQMKPSVLKSYVTHPWWVTGFLMDVSGALLTLAALALAPLSTVQPILGCGLAFVAIFSHYLTADHLRPFDWAGCALCIMGTIGVGLTTAEGSGNEEFYVSVALLLLLFFVGIAAGSETLSQRRLLQCDVASSVSAGVCFGMSACSSKCGMKMSMEYHSSLFAILGVALSIALTSSGFVAQTRGLKDGRALAVVTWSNLVAILVAVIFGVLALSEPLPQTGIGLAARLGSLSLLVAGSYLLQMQGGGSDIWIRSGSKETENGTPMKQRIESKGRGMSVGGERPDGTMLDAVQVLHALDPKQV